MARNLFLLLFLSSSALLLSSAFESDELLQDDEEFGLEVGGPTRIVPDVGSAPSRRTSDSQSVQFSLDHAFGDEDDFAHAGTFTARLKSPTHGGRQTLTKPRFLRIEFTEKEKEAFERVLKEDGYYKIRLPSNVLSPPGRENVVATVRARCLSRKSLDEYIVIHMPTKWSFNSYSFLKNSELARRIRTFAEEMVATENGEGEGVKPPEKSFWAKYWMYLIPFGLIIMNAFTQAMNMSPEEQAGGQPGSQVPQPITQTPVRRR